jgi:phage head maturation protease
MMTLLSDGILTDVSIEFRALKDWMTVTREGDNLSIVHRRAHLTGYAVVPEGAYGQHALVLAHRDAQAAREVEAARAWFAQWKGHSA